MIPRACGCLSRARKIELLANVTSQLSMGIAESFKDAELLEGVKFMPGSQLNESAVNSSQNKVAYFFSSGYLYVLLHHSF